MVDRPDVGLTLTGALAALRAAARLDPPAQRYAAAHLAALRAAASVIAVRARPGADRRRVLSVWALLARVAPELAEWALFFASGTGKRAAAQAGRRVVSTREADDLVRAVEGFIAAIQVMPATAPTWA